MKESIKKIKVAGAPEPAGHYTPGIAYNGMLFISGQLPVRADGSATNTEPLEVQARQVMENVLNIVAAAGGEASDLLKVTVYVVGIENWKLFNQVYIEIMGDAKPARAVVPVPELHHGYLVEVEAVAAVA